LSSRASDHIRLDPKYGVNPSLLQCFVCGEDVGVALMGRLKGGAEAPHRVCIDQEPCEKCKDHMKQGVILISVDESRSEDMKNPHRTGGWCVVRDEALDFIQPDELREDILKRRVAFIEDAAWDEIGLPRRKQ